MVLIPVLGLVANYLILWKSPNDRLWYQLSIIDTISVDTHIIDAKLSKRVLPACPEWERFPIWQQLLAVVIKCIKCINRMISRRGWCRRSWRKGTLADKSFPRKQFIKYSISDACWQSSVHSTSICSKSSCSNVRSQWWFAPATSDLLWERLSATSKGTSLMLAAKMGLWTIANKPLNKRSTS